MARELHAEIAPVPGARQVAGGWRGLAHFSEMWSAADAGYGRWRGCPEIEVGRDRNLRWLT